MHKKLEEGDKVVHIVEASFPLPSAFDQALFQEINQINAGAFWILQAIVINEISKGNITSENIWEGNADKLLDLNNPRIQEMFDQLVIIEEMRHVLYKNIITKEEAITKVEIFLHTYFNDLAYESIKAREKMSECDIIMVVGQQGVGKTAITEFFGSKGYEVVSMSQIIREMIQTWGLDATQTIDKIVGGQIAKEYFGPDILVQLALHYLVSEGKTKVVIDGPRLVEEANAVTKLGGKLIGVIASADSDKDLQIRLDRITQRAIKDPTRAKDVEKFQEREAVEAKKISAILQMVKPEDIVLNEGISQEELLTQLKSQYLEL